MSYNKTLSGQNRQPIQGGYLKSTLLLKYMKRAGELAQLVKRLPCKHEDLHLDPQHPCKSRAHVCNPNAGEGREGQLPGAC